METVEGIQLDNFLELVRRDKEGKDSGELHLADKPFSGYHLKQWLLYASSTPDYSPFWSTCGSWIKRLTLERCRCFGFNFKSHGLRDILFQLTPNLVELRVDGLDTNVGGDDAGLPPIGDNEAQRNLKLLKIERTSHWPIGWANMLTGFPKLETVKLCRVSSTILKELLVAVATARKEGKEVSLRHLEVLYLQDDFSIPHRTAVDLFGDTKLQLLCLESLKIEFGSGIEESAIKLLVQQSSSTLQTLACTRLVPRTRGRDSTFPCPTPFLDFFGESSFEQLKDLRLNGPIVPNFGFLRQTPSLEVLHLDYYTREEVDRLQGAGYEVRRPVGNTFLPEAGVRLETLTEFRTERLFDNQEAFLGLTEWMPNLSRLSAPLTQVTSQLAAATWKSITIIEPRNTAEGILWDEVTREDDPPLAGTNKNEECNTQEGVQMSEISPMEITPEIATAFSPATHPMQVEEVLETLFAVCDPSDLPRFRFVSKDWLRISLKSWRSTATLVIPHKQPGSWEYKPWKGIHLDHFLRLVRSDKEDPVGLHLTDKPFSGFHLKQWLLHPSSTLEYRQFWSTCGTWIKRLQLERCRCPATGGHNLSKILFKLTPNLVELKIDWLDIKLRGDEWEDAGVPPNSDTEAQGNLKLLQIERAAHWPINWANMLKGFPKLETLNLCRITPNVLSDILTALADVRREGKKIPLRHLEMMYLDGDHAITPLMMGLLVDAQLCLLGTLKIEFGSDLDESEVRQLVQQSSSTLRTLFCTRLTGLTEVPLTTDDISFPAFQDFLGKGYGQLKDMRLNGSMAPNFGFLRYTPNLEILHLDYFTQEEHSRHQMRPLQHAFLPEDGVRLAKLTEFRTERLFDNYEAFLGITEWMPHLTRLSAPLTRMTFSLACGAWKSTLQELHITKGGTIGDDILTGLGVVLPGGDFILGGPPPSVTDLKELRKFTQDKGSGGFTDFALLYGFRCLPKLKTLQIFAIEDLSAGVVEILKKKNVDFSWTKCSY